MSGLHGPNIGDMLGCKACLGTVAIRKAPLLLEIEPQSSSQQPVAVTSELFRLSHLWYALIKQHKERLFKEGNCNYRTCQIIVLLVLIYGHVGRSLE